VFCGTAEVVIMENDGSIVRLVEPSGNVGTQYAQDIGSQWFGTLQNLSAGLALAGARWSDIYKTDVMWTTPGPDRETCDGFKNDYNAIYGAMINDVTGGPLNSNRMARFTHPEGFPDPKALFEVQIKAALGATVTVGDGKVAYSTWTDHQPSGASVLHRRDGEVITSLGPDLAQETEFILAEQFGKRLAQQGLDLKTQTVWLETLVAVDDAPEKAWERMEAVSEVIAEYFGGDHPAGLIYAVSRLPNLDGIVEIQPRLVSGEAEIVRSGEIENGHSTWVAIRRPGVTEVLVSGVGGGNAGIVLGTIDTRIRQAGGKGLHADGVFNNAYLVGGADSGANRAALGTFNQQFSAYYQGVVPAGRTAQFVPGFMAEGYQSGISSRAIFASS
jgi:enamine deaminase RidA (YjgF/YER057c/UK114 family)